MPLERGEPRRRERGRLEYLRPGSSFPIHCESVSATVLLEFRVILPVDFEIARLTVCMGPFRGFELPRRPVFQPIVP